MLDFPKSVQKGYEKYKKLIIMVPLILNALKKLQLRIFVTNDDKKYSILKFGMKGSWYSRMIYCRKNTKWYHV